MALPTADVRLGDGTMDLLTISRDSDSTLQQRAKRPGHGSMQLQEFAGVCLQDAGYRARGTEIAAPPRARGLQQPAFFPATAPVVVTVEVLAFLTSGSTHTS
jgi:hypothetical protein